jgi:hypothetical protein
MNALVKVLGNQAAVSEKGRNATNLLNKGLKLEESFAGIVFPFSTVANY